MSEIVTEENAAEIAAAYLEARANFAAPSWNATLAANDPAARSFASNMRLFWGQAVFCVRDNGQVWVFFFK